MCTQFPEVSVISRSNYLTHWPWSLPLFAAGVFLSIRLSGIRKKIHAIFLLMITQYYFGLSFERPYLMYEICKICETMIYVIRERCRIREICRICEIRNLINRQNLQILSKTKDQEIQDHMTPKSLWTYVLCFLSVSR